MPNPYQFTDEKAEEALVEVIRDYADQVPTDIIFTSYQPHTETVVLPRVTVRCTGGSEEELESGIEYLELDVTVESSADQSSDNPDPVALHRLIKGRVFDVLMRDDLHTLMSAAVDDFTVVQFCLRRRGANDTDERRFVSSMTVIATCAAKDIS